MPSIAARATRVTLKKGQNQQACLNRLKFQCKRGNLETELLLVAYLERVIEPSFHQPSELIKQFEALLNESDQSLFNWLLPHSVATENQSDSMVPAQYRTLITDIRDNYLNSSR